MSIPEIVGIYVVIPLAVVALLTVAIFGKSIFQPSGRYRPGRPWPYEPVWYLPHSAKAARQSTPEHKALTAASRAALDRANDPTGPGSPGTSSAVGGAVGEW